jgi:hypothetical protein
MLKLAMKKIPKKRWIFSLISLFFLGYLTFFGTFLFRKEYWKSILLEKAKSIIGYNLTYSKEDISLFPYPEIAATRCLTFVIPRFQQVLAPRFRLQ